MEVGLGLGARMQRMGIVGRDSADNSYYAGDRGDSHDIMGPIRGSVFRDETIVFARCYGHSVAGRLCNQRHLFGNPGKAPSSTPTA